MNTMIICIERLFQVNKKIEHENNVLFKFLCVVQSISRMAWLAEFPVRSHIVNHLTNYAFVYLVSYDFTLSIFVKVLNTCVNRSYIFENKTCKTNAFDGMIVFT